MIVFFSGISRAVLRVCALFLCVICASFGVPSTAHSGMIPPVLRAPNVKARVRIWSLAEFIESPMEPLQTLVDEISPRSLRRLTEVPRMVDLTGFGQFLQNLRNQGMQPVLMGDFPASGDLRPPTTRRGRPYLVK